MKQITGLLHFINGIEVAGQRFVFLSFNWEQNMYIHRYKIKSYIREKCSPVNGIDSISIIPAGNMYWKN